MLIVSLALPAGAVFPIAPLPTALAALCIGALIVRRAGLSLGIGALAAAVAGAALARSELSEGASSRARARDEIMGPRRCVGDGRIEQSPVQINGALSFTAHFDSLDCEGRLVDEAPRVRLYGGFSDLVRGDVVHVVAQLAPVRVFRNADLTDTRPRATRARVVLSGAVLSLQLVSSGRGLGAWIDRARLHARQRIDATFSPAAAPMARALVLGENDLDAEDAVAFRSSGLSHLLAVSGTHLVFAVVAIVQALRALLARVELVAARFDVMRIASGIGAVLALVYADFAGGSGSAWRAAWMLAAALFARALDRRPKASRALAVSILVGFAFDPLVAFDVSFVLSAAATAGLMIFGRLWSRAIPRVPTRALQFAAGAVIATVASMLPCAPVLAMLGPSITVAGVVANVFAMPLGEAVALPLCLLHPLTTSIPVLERGFALVASGALLAIKWLAHASADAKWAAVAVPVPNPWHYAVIAVGACGWLLASRSFKRSWGVATLGALFIVEGAAFVAGHPQHLLRVTSLDVEQGDSTLIDFPDGSAMLVDAGGFVGVPIDPGETVVGPVLRARRRSRIDVVVLTHPHPDHFGGLVAALRDVQVGEFWDTGQGRAQGAGPAYAALIDFLRSRHVAIRSPEDVCKAPRYYGSAVITVLSPCPTFESGVGANDNSFVIKVEIGKRAALLMGDAERHAEQRLLALHGDRLRADWLKVGHHGSRTSSSAALLDAVHPEYAVISCGVRNRFGHPHAETLQALEHAGAAVLRLDRTGSAEWLTNGDWQWVTVFGRDP